MTHCINYPQHTPALFPTIPTTSVSTTVTCCQVSRALSRNCHHTYTTRSNPPRALGRLSHSQHTRFHKHLRQIQPTCHRRSTTRTISPELTKHTTLDEARILSTKARLCMSLLSQFRANRFQLRLSLSLKRQPGRPVPRFLATSVLLAPGPSTRPRSRMTGCTDMTLGTRGDRMGTTKALMVDPETTAIMLRTRFQGSRLAPARQARLGLTRAHRRVKHDSMVYGGQGMGGQIDGQGG